jgi:hypothetical protein
MKKTITWNTAKAIDYKSKFYLISKETELITEVFYTLKELEEFITLHNVKEQDFYIEEQRDRLAY